MKVQLIDGTTVNIRVGQFLQCNIRGEPLEVLDSRSHGLGITYQLTPNGWDRVFF